MSRRYGRCYLSKEIHKATSKITIIFQQTLDKRLIKFLYSKKIHSIEAIDGRKIGSESNQISERLSKHYMDLVENQIK